MRVHRWIAAAASTIALVAAMLIGGVGVRQAAVDEPTLHFTASGDFSSGANALSVFSRIGTIAPDLHLALGDLSYGTVGREQVWCDLVTARVGAGFPFELLAGNHESNGQNGNINDFSACLPNQLPGLVGTYGRQYYVDIPAEAPLVRYVMISPGIPFTDGTWSYAAGTPRYSWTAKAIDGARTANIPWVVVGMHKPCLSLGEYQCDPGAAIMNLLVDKRVDLVLSGHEHLFQRSHQLATGDECSALAPNSFTPACVVDSDQSMVKGAGTVFATVGTGGVSPRNVNLADTEFGYFSASSGSNSNPTFGSLDVTASATELTAHFDRAAGGPFTDSFTLGPADPTVNSAPVARPSGSCVDLACDFSGSTSTDGDGTIQAYEWDLGDGTSASGTAVSHVYSVAGPTPCASR